MGPSTWRYCRILWTWSHTSSAVSYCSGHLNPGMFPYFPCHILMLVAAARVEGTAWSLCRALATLILLEKMVFKHFPLGTQLFTCCSDSLCISISLAVPFFLEDCLNSSCRSCLLCAWAITCFLELSCLCLSGFSLAEMRFTVLKTELSFFHAALPEFRYFCVRWVVSCRQNSYQWDVCLCLAERKYRSCAK